ncbi:hypothetical protein HanPSC8_Chr07g0303881 [Helianthus annuus]|nr:hypothetical protein HanIR_Chr07g0339331 [Helianthus annuus]KAJ0906293.1 hypothetical protein HanPSC8_Chr07g0303881 [Helianthus annuus]
MSFRLTYFLHLIPRHLTLIGTFISGAHFLRFRHFSLYHLRQLHLSHMRPLIPCRSSHRYHRFQSPLIV